VVLNTSANAAMGGSNLRLDPVILDKLSKEVREITTLQRPLHLV
jgi:hypothetical protein